MPPGYRAGYSGWPLYGRGPDKQRLTQYQSKLGTVMMIVITRCVEDYQVIRSVGLSTARVACLTHKTQLDTTLLKKIPHLHTSGLLVMDMDFAATQVECIDEVAKLAGMGERVAEIAEQMVRDEFDSTTNLCSHVTTLKGTDANILQQARENLPLVPDLTQLMLKLGTLGWKVVIVSGGFTFFVEYLRDKLRPMAVVVNELGIIDGKLTGNVIGDIVDIQHRAGTLTRLVQKYETPLVQTVAIGDGASDPSMIKATGLGIAHHTKPKVNEKAEVTIHHVDLMGVFYIPSGSLNQR